MLLNVDDEPPTYFLCKPSWSRSFPHCSWNRRARWAPPRPSPDPKKNPSENVCDVVAEPGTVGESSQPLWTFMEFLSSKASYCVVLLIRPSIRASREPDSAPFRAVIRSWKVIISIVKLSVNRLFGSQSLNGNLQTFLASRSYSKAISRRWG